ncbi:MAG TPA: DJ-1/PfpI family protein [Gammaproteobacteria bacterium]|nr:DJ-1/PfpI family protein [Gammaproteobacteria bacterium]
MQITFLFYDGMTALDAIGPHEVLCRLPSVSIKRVAKTAGKINTCSGVILNADYAISDVSASDILLVPGAGNATTLQDSPGILEWIRSIHAGTQWTTSVCTGSLILGAAGILSGIRATSHWAVLDRLKKWGAHPVDERVVESGKIITAAGVSAGIDMALTLAAKIAGEQIAKTIQLGIEYDPEPPFDGGSLKNADPELVEALRQRLMDRFEKE